MKTRFFTTTAALVTAAVLLAPLAAQAAIYDARTLGMGGSTVGYAGNASLAFWNPASVAVSRQSGVFLPTVSAQLTNNMLSVGEVQGLVGAIGQGATGGLGTFGGTLFGKLGAGGLNAQVDTIVEPFGMALGQVGPGSLALRVYGRGIGGARAALSADFAQNMNGLFAQNGFTDIAATIQSISAEAGKGAGASQSQLQSDVDKLQGLLNTHMSSFIKRNGGETVKSFDVQAMTGANAALATTYAQPVALPKIAALPDAQLSLGATAKLFGNLGAAMPSGMAALPVPGAPAGSTLSPVGGVVGANVSLNIDKEVTNLVRAVEAFKQSQNLATTSDLASRAGALLNEGFGEKSSFGFSAVTPSAVGAGLDLGAALQFNKEWSAGLAVANPLVFWPGTRTNYRYNLSGDAIRVDRTQENVNFTQTEPLAVRLGGAYQPAAIGGLLLSGGVDAPVFTGVAPSLSLGAEKLIGPLALRLGTQQGGIAPLYTAGLGVQTRAFQMNLGLGVDSPLPSAMRGGALALSVGAGF